MKRMVCKGLAALLLLGMTVNTNIIAASGTETKSFHSMVLSGKVIPKVSTISVEMPLVVPVTINLNEKNEQDMFQSPTINIINRTEGTNPVKISYQTGGIQIENKQATLVSPTYFKDWGSLNKTQSKQYMALGVESIEDGWGIGSPITIKSIWLDSESKDIGVIPSLGDSVEPNVAKFKYIAKHGQGFPGENIFTIQVFLKAEIQS